MNPVVIVAVLVGIVALATVIGLIWRATNGRLKVTEKRETVSLPELTDDAGGVNATLLQFSTEVCAPCVTTHALLVRLAGEIDGVAHVDVDVTHRPDVANRFNLLQSPTTLILDSRGIIRARIGGAPRPAEVRAELQRILAA
jgi:thiol-disulfide isomerase/thioredoxin